MIKIFFALFFAFFKMDYTIASTVTGSIKGMRTGPYYGQMVAITINPAPLNQPSCHNLGSRGNYLIDTSTPGGKNLYAMALSASFGASEVIVYGAGFCYTVGSFQGEAIETFIVQ